MVSLDEIAIYDRKISTVIVNEIVQNVVTREELSKIFDEEKNTFSLSLGDIDSYRIFRRVCDYLINKTEIACSHVFDLNLYRQYLSYYIFG